MQKKRDCSAGGVSETASEKAVKDAMMKTTQKIYFPRAFQMPGSKSKKADKSTSNACDKASPSKEPREESPDCPQKQQYSSVKRATVNLDNDE